VTKTLYFAYGSNMNQHQMAARCPDAEVIGKVSLEGYRLAFRSSGVATILLEEGGRVEGVLWRISAEDEQRLDIYEGYPRLYGKEEIEVKLPDGCLVQTMVYTMNPPYCQQPALPPMSYLIGILEGCAQNGVDGKAVLDAAKQTKQEVVRQHSKHREQGKER
jgi:gamma-glutamylcyclotransferase (GGCT)/AIG2-like uncharacterized protein YtfP